MQSTIYPYVSHPTITTSIENNWTLSQIWSLPWLSELPPTNLFLEYFIKWTGMPSPSKQTWVGGEALGD